MRPVLLVIGTRPEGIKMIPVYFALKDLGCNVLLCSTSQHNNLLTNVLNLFDVKPDFELNIMKAGQDLFYLTHTILLKVKEILELVEPSIVLVQGDTTTAMAAALAAFYFKIPVGHVEAGLRTPDIYVPFPEEMNRRFITLLSTYHFAPTQLAVSNLLDSGISQDAIFCTGNTIVDALHIIQKKIENGILLVSQKVNEICKTARQKNYKIVLFTMHRRESFDGGVERVLSTLTEALLKFPDLLIIYPFHPNPHIIRTIEKLDLKNCKRLIVCEPLSHSDLVYLYSQVKFIITDSGGIQEEATSVSKPVIVLREHTERMEAVWAGLAVLAGTSAELLIKTIEKFMKNERKISETAQLYGDGKAAHYIAQIVSDHCNSVPNSQQSSPIFADRINNKNYFQIKRSRMEKVCVIGLGYIGLPTSLIAAQSGFQVAGYDSDVIRIARINAGDPVIQEPEVYGLLQKILNTELFSATATICSADYFVIAVPTPFQENNTSEIKKADLNSVWDAAEKIATVLKKGDTVILESTVPVGTTEKLAHILEEKTGLKVGLDFYCAYCPERVFPGKIIYELCNNPRIIGGINHGSIESAKKFYRNFVKADLYLTSAASAELVKLIENSYRDVTIAFANQVSAIAESLNLNPYEIIELANKHPRVNILQPRCGVGGHCIAVDPWFLIEKFEKFTDLLKVARKINDAKPFQVLENINSYVKTLKKTEPCKILILGATYKPDVDDLRQSPALLIAQRLSEEKTNLVRVCEPYCSVDTLARNGIANVTTFADGLAWADLIVILVDHSIFKTQRTLLQKQRNILDFCGLLYQEHLPQEKQEYMFWPAMTETTDMELFL